MKMIDRVCPVCGKTFQVMGCDWRIKHRKQLYCSRNCAFIGSRTGKEVNCPICGKLFYTTRAKTCSIECGRELKKQKTVHRPYYENGYLVEYKNGYNKKGNVKQHRRIMEEYLGRPLMSNEVVHHINGNKEDNRIENLQLMTRGQHSSYHRKIEKESGKHLFGGYHNN